MYDRIKEITEIRLAEAVIFARVDQWKHWASLSVWASAMQGGMILLALTLRVESLNSNHLTNFSILRCVFISGFLSLLISIVCKVLQTILDGRFAAQELLMAKAEKIVEDHQANVNAIAETHTSMTALANTDPDWKAVFDAANRFLPRMLRAPKVETLEDAVMKSASRLKSTVSLVCCHMCLVIFQLILTVYSGVTFARAILC